MSLFQKRNVFWRYDKESLLVFDRQKTNFLLSSSIKSDSLISLWIRSKKSRKRERERERKRERERVSERQRERET